MQTTSQQILINLPCESFFLNLVRNPQLLSKGYELVYKYLSLSAKNRQDTLLHLLSEKVPILTLVTRTYPLVYSDNSINISPQQKLNTKTYLILQILMKKIIPNINKSNKENIKLLNSFIRFLLNFHHNQGFEQWTNHYQKLLQQLVRINSDFIGYILIQLLKESDDRVSCFSKHILKFIIRNQANIQISQQQSLQIIYYCIKSMAYLNGTDNQVIDQYVQPFVQQILNYIQLSLSKSITIMKYSLKLLTVFAADYQIQFQKGLINTIKQCSKQIILQFLNNLQTCLSNEQLDEDEQQNSPSLNLLIYQMIELISTLLSTEQLKISDYSIYLILCLPSLLLNQKQFNEYSKSTDLYLSSLQDEHEKTLRNKAISFLLQLQQGDYPSKSKNKFKIEILKYALLIKLSCQNEQKFGEGILSFYSQFGLTINLQKYHLVLFEQSITFLLYNLTQQILTTQPKSLQQNKQLLMLILGNKIKLLPINFNLLKVSYLNLLNKIIKSMTINVKLSYYEFLIEQLFIQKHTNLDKGFLLALCRGIAYISNDINLIITQDQNIKGIPIQIIISLLKILLDQNNLQESAHLILQFFVILINKCKNGKAYLQKYLNSQIQMKILTNFIHDGTIVDTVLGLLGQIANQDIIKYIYGQFSKGTTKQQNLSYLIAVWIKNQMLTLSEIQIANLLNVYNNNFVSKIIKEFLKQTQIKSLSISIQLAQIINKYILSNWILQMMANNILKNPQAIFFSTIQNITYNLTSQYQIENQLILPYFTFIKQPSFAVNSLKNKNIQLYQKFIDKLIKYATLFQGSCLKIVTSNVLLNICEIDHSKTKIVLQLIQSYGKVQTQQWQDQDQQDGQNAIDKMFNLKIINDEVQKQFLQIFGDQVFNMKLINQRVSKINSLIS